MASQWNSAGTWEERDRSQFARDFLKKQLDQLSFSNLTTKSVHTCKGDARKLHVRGKDRAGFEFAIKVILTGSVDGTELTITAEGHDIAETDIDDVDLNVSFSPSTVANKQDLEKAVVKAISQAFEALKQAILSS
eukprot:TRINITY_DN11920_c1_g3_i2.p1 TRINITY_DN11920_c1_g3~~TRINITY_DN11920_c1_g3_i2.p1  ORF type:complete len:135 (+),score=37.17 TRINITY_DN11920_c1_g3_i2:93-497(+)